MIERGLGLQDDAAFEATGYDPPGVRILQGWSTDITTMSGGDIPKALSTENLNPGYKYLRGGFTDEKLLRADSWNVTHILVDNFERLRKSCTHSSKRSRMALSLPRQLKENAARAFFSGVGFDIVDEIVATNQVKLHPWGNAR